MWHEIKEEVRIRPFVVIDKDRASLFECFDSLEISAIKAIKQIFASCLTNFLYAQGIIIWCGDCSVTDCKNNRVNRDEVNTDPHVLSNYMRFQFFIR